MEKLKAIFKTIGRLSESDQAALLSTVKRRNVPAKAILQEEGRTGNSIFFIEQGMARTFYYKDGKDITYWIGMEGDFVGSMSSFFMREPSNKLVETIEESILWEFEYYKLEQLFGTNLELSEAGRRFANYGISLMERRFDNLHFHSAKERYQLLLKEHPDLVLRIPLGIIASYLGITQETLSRIRSSR